MYTPASFVNTLIQTGMKSTNTTEEQPNALYNELEAILQYLILIKLERLEKQRISRQWYRRKLSRILAEKDVFKLEQEIAAKTRYLEEIKNSIDRLEGGKVVNLTQKP